MKAIETNEEDSSKKEDHIETVLLVHFLSA